MTSILQFHRLPIVIIALSVSPASQVSAQQPHFDAKHLPRFEDFPASESWSPPSAKLKLTDASERMFRTKLTDASRQPPNFNGHFRMTYWGCGSNCAAEALIDIQTGDLFPPPLAAPGGV